MHKYTTYLMFITGIFVVGSARAQPTADHNNPCIACDALKELQLPDVSIVETMAIDDDSGVYCKLLGTISKEINFELLLPTIWNERFLMSGGGGFVGSIQNGLRGRVKDGYATAGTDTGHQGHGLKADWAFNQMERQLNFGRLAIHRTAVVSQAIIRSYYCTEAAYSYFMGCSRGGGQALIEAQLFPEDFDGIVAAAPVIDWPATGAEFIQNIRSIYPDPSKLGEAIISPRHLQLLQESVLAQCDELDQVADGILNDPRDCKIDFSKLPTCEDDLEGEDCFTSTQIAAIKSIYAGVSSQGAKIYPGFPPGCESDPAGWQPWIVGPNEGSMALNFPSLQFGFGTEMFKYLVFQDPDWDYSSYDFSNYFNDTKYAASYLNATSTDYSVFKNKRGKLIINHGWSDPALSALTSIEHVEAAKKIDPDLDSFLRLFLLPGVVHCGGGSGPSQADWLTSIRNWVEQGEAPERIILSKESDGKVQMTRPVFPYPKKAVYDGKGDPNEESSFN